jgi:predicted molibdopterin-dependent oxidoreductase YjgC
MSTIATPTGLLDLTIDGQPVRVPVGTSVFDAARMNGVPIPTLCHLQNDGGRLPPLPG